MRRVEAVRHMQRTSKWSNFDSSACMYHHAPDLSSWILDDDSFSCMARASDSDEIVPCRPGLYGVADRCFCECPYLPVGQKITASAVEFTSFSVQHHGEVAAPP